MSAQSTREATVQAQLDAYNAQDLDAHCALFTEDVVVANYNGDIVRTGLEAYAANYKKVFAEFPKNRAVLLNRICVRDTVIDHEHVDRGDGSAPFQVIAIYTFNGDKIARVDFAR
jgi:uncharacterized protein (TIGR02246 family)